MQFWDFLLITTQVQFGFIPCFVRDDFLFTKSSQTLIELSQITGIIWAKSVIEEDFPSNYREMAVLIKVLITEGDSIFGSFRLCLFTTKSQMVSPAWNQKYKLEQFSFARSRIIRWISHKDILCSWKIVWVTIAVVEIQVRAVLNNLLMGTQFREM